MELIHSYCSRKYFCTQELCVRKPEYARLLRVESVDVMVNIARDPKFDKVKPVIG
jgi:hypothetical protein